MHWQMMVAKQHKNHRANAQVETAFGSALSKKNAKVPTIHMKVATAPSATVMICSVLMLSMATKKALASSHSASQSSSPLPSQAAEAIDRHKLTDTLDAPSPPQHGATGWLLTMRRCCAAVLFVVVSETDAAFTCPQTAASLANGDSRLPTRRPEERMIDEARLTVDTVRAAMRNMEMIVTAEIPQVVARCRLNSSPMLKLPEMLLSLLS